MAINKEIYILAGLKHPSIMKLFEVIDTTKKCNLIMELCEGSTLLSYIRKTPHKQLSEADAKPIMRQIVSAVVHMHSLNIVHRDLKVENILIDDSDGQIKIKLIDFGFATVCQPGKKLDLYCGTPCYMDPDLIRNRNYRGQAADVWAIGVIIYLIITGQVPFFGKDENELRSNIARCQLGAPNQLKMMSKPL